MRSGGTGTGSDRAATPSGVEPRRVGFVVVAGVVVVVVVNVVVAEVDGDVSVTDERLDAAVCRHGRTTAGDTARRHDDSQAQAASERPAGDVEREHGRQNDDDHVADSDDDATSGVNDR